MAVDFDLKHLVSREVKLADKAASFWAEVRFDILNHIVPGVGRGGLGLPYPD